MSWIIQYDATTKEYKKVWVEDSAKPEPIPEENLKYKPLTESEVFTLFAKQQINTLSVDSYYPTWRELVDTGFTAEKSGFKFTYRDDLYKTVSSNQQFLENWIPGQGTESIFERINETHEGTKEDPIPYKVNMTVYADKYYTEDGILYRCTRDSDIPLQNKASELVGHYFEVVE